MSKGKEIQTNIHQERKKEETNLHQKYFLISSSSVVHHFHLKSKEIVYLTFKQMCYVIHFPEQSKESKNFYSRKISCSRPKNYVSRWHIKSGRNSFTISLTYII